MPLVRLKVASASSDHTISQKGHQQSDPAWSRWRVEIHQRTERCVIKAEAHHERADGMDKSGGLTRDYEVSPGTGQRTLECPEASACAENLQRILH